jgi:predicted HTH transcriptional regulator
MHELSLNNPIFEERSKNVVIMTLENNIANRKYYEQNSAENKDFDVFVDGLNDREMEVIQYLNEHGKITTKDLATILGTSDKPARAILQSLVDKKVLKWHGTSSRNLSQYFTLDENSEVLRSIPKQLRSGYLDIVQQCSLSTLNLAPYYRTSMPKHAQTGVRTQKG